MPIPRAFRKSTARDFPCRMRRWAGGFICVAILMGNGTVRAQNRPAWAPGPTDNPIEAVSREPLSVANWPRWREVCVRIYFDDDTDPDQERNFYERIRTFFAATAAVSDGSLPKELASDSIAWVAFSWTYPGSDGGPGDAANSKLRALAEDAGRKAIALGDPHAIASYNLAAIIVSGSSFPGPNQPLTSDMERRLGEAEERLRQVERISPRANVMVWRGRIAELRGDRKNAASLLRRSTEEHPKSALQGPFFIS